jgi:hypothetical protein
MKGVAMKNFEIVDCPGELESGDRCGSIAEIVGRYVLDSTDGPVEHVNTRCLKDKSHAYNMPTARLELPVVSTENAA